MEPKKCILDINTDGPKKYEITIKTGDGANDGTKSPISMSINGEKGNGPMTTLTEKGATSASAQKFTVSSEDVGAINGFTVALENKDKWKVAEVTIIDLSKLN
jgi:hypothetical protein